MNHQSKKDVAFKLQNYVAGFPSQKQAVNTLPNVSEATIINMLKGNWDNISDEMWQSVLVEIELRMVEGEVVETTNFNTLMLYYLTAKEEGESFAIVGEAGYGKTFAGKKYAAVNRNRNVFFLQCAEYWSKKRFLAQMLMAMGRPNTGMNIEDMMDDIIREIRTRQQPLFIIDEIDKLADPVFIFFVTLYNFLDKHCGFVFQSTDFMRKRMNKGLNTNKKGYKEVFSRIGSKFIELIPTPKDDVKAVAHSMGINDPEKVAQIINECNGDLRRVRRNMIKEKAIANRRRINSAA